MWLLMGDKVGEWLVSLEDPSQIRAHAAIQPRNTGTEGDYLQQHAVQCERGAAHAWSGLGHLYV